MHFIAVCHRYPEFSLTVASLRKFLREREAETDAPVAHFHNGIFDSEREGWTEEEADIIRKAIEKCVEHPPLYGRDIQILAPEIPTNKKHKEQALNL